MRLAKGILPYDSRRQTHVAGMGLEPDVPIHKER
jgi:hypothetical protein